MASTVRHKLINNTNNHMSTDSTPFFSGPFNHNSAVFKELVPLKITSKICLGKERKFDSLYNYEDQFYRNLSIQVLKFLFKEN